MKVFQRVVVFAVSLVGIVLAGGLPALLSGLNEKKLNFSQYWQVLQGIIDDLLNPGSLTYTVIGGQKERDLFPYLFDPIQYSLTVLFSSFFLALILALVCTIVSMLFSERVRSRIKLALYFLESLPDLLIILMAQFIIVYYYKKSGILLFNTASTYEEKAYFLPILLLAILPAIQLFKVSILSFETEIQKDYVLLARSIGVGKLMILISHVLRNSIVSVFFQSKKTVWFMLSNLFVIELLFNIPGITRFLLSTMQPILFVLSLLSVFIPLFLFYNLGELVLSNKANRGEEL
ncbi:ABC transporter permease subunit [Rossellomorea vietnamensis]|uniref:ABC transporter permease subunit n=1 Tax=Rossellomorea vietnamensis TaxID=218284 RepID=A0A5D4MID3_9BACI|nr:ABC transporter permease subunit [Rossellomorea vietnamensis]TYS01422.1 ABC transporter permease subunit [Rossellomorea vietnamensis]